MRVFHPERTISFFGEDEEHASIRREEVSVHESPFLFEFIFCKFNRTLAMVSPVGARMARSASG
jgi:hypothetical protein